MIKFYCEECEKELWQYAEWEHIKSYTLEEIKGDLTCSACLLEELRKDFPPCPECGCRSGHHADCKQKGVENAQSRPK